MLHPFQLESIVRDIRDNTPRQEGQSIDEFMRYTWRLALERYEQEKPVLPLVEAQQEESARRLQEEMEHE